MSDFAGDAVAVTARTVFADARLHPGTGVARPR
jgi:hypothetical protein